jgi:hypothetical protein
MADSFTEVTGKSWFGRIGESIKGVLFGLVLFLASFVILFWNEGRAVTTARSLAEGASSVVSVDPAAVQPANEGKLVHFTGTATTTDELQDPLFQIKVIALKLQRRVEMYQWVEDKKSETKKKLGGGEETTTTYTYSRQWSQEWHDSSKFKEASDHLNPPQALASQNQTAPKVTVGAFLLSTGLVGQIRAAQPLDIPADAKPGDAAFKKTASGFYQGADPDAPAVGDLRISFSVVKPQEVSVIAQQTGGTLRPYQTKAGDALEILAAGNSSAQAMFSAEQARNTRLTWILRLVGFLAMWIGLMMVANPFKVLADVVPFLGNLVGAGLALVAAMIALPLSLLTIAIAWFVYRPLLSIILLAVGGAAAFGIWTLIKKRQPKPLAATA